jgi:hypothetical protein
MSAKNKFLEDVILLCLPLLGKGFEDTSCRMGVVKALDALAEGLNTVRSFFV